tara:strand:- start:974 stop:1684 length:711 start_codon:yes stop_codon:yes gene_type:complete
MLIFSALSPIGARQPSGGLTSEIHQPASTTALLRAGFNTDEATFDTNTISAAEVGSVTHNASGGIGGGGYVSGLSGSNYYSITSQATGSATSGNWLTMFCGIQTSNSSNASNIYNVAVPCFGDAAGNGFSFGVSGGVIDIGNGSATTSQLGSVNVDDGSWHLLCWQQTAQTSWQCWVDGSKDGSTASNPYSASSAIVQIGHDINVTAYPSAIDAVQIYQPSLSDAQIEEIFTNAGF